MGRADESEQLQQSGRQPRLSPKAQRRVARARAKLDATELEKRIYNRLKHAQSRRTSDYDSIFQEWADSGGTEELNPVLHAALEALVKANRREEFTGIDLEPDRKAKVEQAVAESAHRQKLRDQLDRQLEAHRKSDYDPAELREIARDFKENDPIAKEAMGNVLLVMRGVVKKDGLQRLRAAERALDEVRGKPKQRVSIEGSPKPNDGDIDYVAEFVGE